MEGIEETKEIIAFIQVLAETIREAKEYGNIDIFDAVKALKDAMFSLIEALI